MHWYRLRLGVLDDVLEPRVQDTLSQVIIRLSACRRTRIDSGVDGVGAVTLLLVGPCILLMRICALGLITTASKVVVFVVG